MYVAVLLMKVVMGGWRIVQQGGGQQIPGPGMNDGPRTICRVRHPVEGQNLEI